MLVVAAVLVALAMVVGVVALTALRGRLVTPVDQGTAGPVLLVPGYGGSAASLQSLATRTARVRSGRHRGRPAGPGPGRPDRPVGRARDDRRARSSPRTGARSVDVVGYSAGGVVARLWATEGDGPGKVRRLVMLGSPLHGTDVARLGTLVSGTCPAACQQLAPDSPVLAAWTTSQLPTGVLGLSLWTTSDEVVQPPTSSVEDDVPSPSVQSVCAASQVNHGGLPNDRVVQAMVLEALGTGPIPTWAPGDCGRLSS